MKNRAFWTVALEKTLESPLDCKEIQPVHPKGNQSWIFIERTGAEAEVSILWPPDAKNWLTGKDPDAGKDWRWEEKGMTEDEMVGWHHWLNGREFEQLWETVKEREPGVLQSMGSQRVGHDWATEQQQQQQRPQSPSTLLQIAGLPSFSWLSCCYCTWDLLGLCEISCRGAWTLVVGHRLSSCSACGILVPWVGIEPALPASPGDFQPLESPHRSY